MISIWVMNIVSDDFISEGRRLIKDARPFPFSLNFIFPLSSLSGNF